MLKQLAPEVITLLWTLGLTLLAHFFASLLLRRSLRLAAMTDNLWDDALLNAALRPLPLLIWVVGLATGLHFIERDIGMRFALLDDGRTIAILLCLAWFGLNLVRTLTEGVIAARTRHGETVDHTTLQGLAKVARILIVTLAALGIMQTLGFNLSGVLAMGSVGGVVIGFAARDLIANFFGGLIIHLDRPFALGETIRSPDKQLEGVVEHIGWRQTTIRSLNKTLFYVPNSLFNEIVVENPSRMSHRRLREIIGLRYDDLGRIPAIVADIRDLLGRHPDIDPAEKIVVGFDQFGESSLNLLVQAWTRTTDLAEFHRIKQNILLDIAAIIARHDAEIAFPTHTVLLHEKTPMKPGIA